MSTSPAWPLSWLWTLIVIIVVIVIFIVLLKLVFAIIAIGPTALDGGSSEISMLKWTIPL